MKRKLVAFCLGLMITGAALTARAQLDFDARRPPRRPLPDPVPTYMVVWSTPTQATCFAYPHDCVVDLKKPGVVIDDLGQVVQTFNTPIGL